MPWREDMGGEQGEGEREGDFEEWPAQRGRLAAGGAGAACGCEVGEGQVALGGQGCAALGAVGGTPDRLVHTLHVVGERIDGDATNETSRRQAEIEQDGACSSRRGGGH